MLPKAPKKQKKVKKMGANDSEETFEEGAVRADVTLKKKLLPALCIRDESVEEQVC